MLTLVFLSFHSEHHIRRLVKSIDSKYPIIIIENSANKKLKSELENLYKNVLDRLPDNQGFNYWLNQIEKGYENRSDLLMGFSESLENKAIFSEETNIF